MQNQYTEQKQESNGEFGDVGFMESLGSDTATPEQHSEGKVARAIEEQTAKLPSDLFLWAAIGAIGASAIAEFTGHHDKSRFFGQWVAPFMLLGVYNKLVKLHGSDQVHQNS